MPILKDIIFDIPPSTAGFHSQSADVTFDLNAEISSGNSSGVSLSASNVKSATVSSVSVDITSGSNTANSFANFSDGGVALYSNVAPTQVSVAQVMNNPDVNSVHLEIPVTGTSDISSYLKGSVITYLYGYSLRRATTATLHAVMHVKYAITLGL